MPRDRASLARSIASIERGALSGSGWAWMSITPVRVWADRQRANSEQAKACSTLVDKVIDLFHYPDIILRLAVVRQKAVDLLLDVGQLRITVAGEGGNLCDRRVQAAQPRQCG